MAHRVQAVCGNAGGDAFVMDAVLAEVRSAPIAALGGMSSFLAFLFMLLADWIKRKGTIVSSEEGRSPLRLSMFAHSVLWPGSAICIAYMGYKLSPILGAFLAFASYGVGVYTLDVQSKRFGEAERESGGLAIAAIASALVFGVYWQGLIEFVTLVFTQYTDVAFLAGFLTIGSIVLTVIGTGFYFFVAAPDFSRRHLGDK